jgi:asparagine synthase (glutamine-hydrolysing)
MCGIVGAVSASPLDPQVVVTMRDTLAHRGPDHAGIWVSSDARAVFGHRRLAIVDLTPDANQPFLSHDGRFVITFNGEIYNFKSLREELRAYGVEFRTQSDTEVLVEAFRRWGEQCLERLSGMFAFAIWDTRHKRLFSARDRAGEKPFYYCTVNGSFVFASELKALLHYPGVRRQLHYPALIDYLSFGYVPDPKSIWEGCHKLPPGHSLVVSSAPEDRPQAAAPAAYWDMRFAPDTSVTDWESRILDTLQAASREMSFADVPVGAFLSGGVDSSSVTAALSKAGCAVNTFTIGFEERDYDERAWARQVAGLYRTAHTERIVVARDVAPVFQKILWHYDEPFHDYSYLPTFFICQEARKFITVALSGDGGDEVFAGYPKYQRIAVRERLDSSLLGALAGPLGANLHRLAPTTSRLGGVLRQYISDPAAAIGEMLNTGIPFTALRRAARGELAQAMKHYNPIDVVLQHLRQAPPREVGLVNAMRYVDLKLTLAGDILVKVDRASMAVSLEVRPVYLHKDILGLAATIPPRLLASRVQAKKVLKSALRAWLPEALLYRRKMGFAVPLARWIDGNLQPIFGEARQEFSLDDWLDEQRVTGARGARRAGSTSVMHNVFLLKHWLARWTEAPRIQPSVRSATPGTP